MIEIIIIGAGASGMIAAIEASKEALKVNKEVRVTILEHNSVHGRKLLATGNGRCNLTNRQLNTNCFRSHDMERLESYLHADDNCKADKIIAYFEELGMLCADKNGYVYPYSYQASTVNDVLYNACVGLGVNIIYDSHVLAMEKKVNGGYIVKASEGYIDDDGNRKKRRYEYNADKVIMACGSKAYSKLGADGSGYKMAAAMGMKIIDVVPALTGLKCKEKHFSLAAGARTNAEISLYVDHEFVAKDKGELQLTDYGISGIPVFQISRFASYGMADGCKVHAVIDFMPDYKKEDIFSFITHSISGGRDADIYKILCGMINSRIARMVLTSCRIDENKIVSCIDEEEINHILDSLKAFYTVIIGTNDFEQSQICAGGVKLSEIDDNFESKRMSGLYITGELLDVDGMCGGYNLHWAWISGITAGKHTVKG